MYQPAAYSHNQAFISSYSSIFPLLLLPQSPEPTPFPAFGSLPTHRIISLVQSQNALLLHPIMWPTPLGSNTLESQWALQHWLILMGVNAWRPGLSPGSSPGRGPEKVFIPLSPYCGSPCAPLGSRRWTSDRLVAPGMGLGEARAGSYLGSPIHHGLSLVLCGCAWELSANNLTNCHLHSRHHLIKDPNENFNENVSTGAASQHAIGYQSAQTRSRRAAFIFNISQSQRRDIFTKRTFVKDLQSINNCLQSIPLLLKLKGKAARLL